MIAPNKGKKMEVTGFFEESGITAHVEQVDR